MCPYLSTRNNLVCERNKWIYYYFYYYYYIHAGCHCRTSLLHVSAACLFGLSCCMSMLYVRPAFPSCRSLLHAISMLHFMCMLHVHVVCPCWISLKWKRKIECELKLKEAKYQFFVLLRSEKNWSETGAYAKQRTDYSFKLWLFVHFQTDSRIFSGSKRGNLARVSGSVHGSACKS